MKKLINLPENYTDDMLQGIYAAHGDKVCHPEADLHAYCVKNKKMGKVAIVTGGGTGHLPLFLGYVGDGLLDGCACGNVFQSPSAETVYNVSKEVEAGAGILYLLGNYTGDKMNFEMSSEMCEMDGIKTKTVIGMDDVYSGEPTARRGVAGIFYLYKAAGAKAAQMATLDEVYEAAVKTAKGVRTVGFAFSPCVIPEVGKPNFTLSENEMAMGMGIHGEPGIWNGPVKSSKEIANEILDTILKDMPISRGEEVSLLFNGLGATSIEELYVLCGDVISILNEKGIKVYKTFVGEFATSMEMAGASLSICKLDDEIKEWLDYPVDTPFIKVK